MTASQRNSFRFYGGLFVLGCALLSILVQLLDWVTAGEKLRLGVSAVLLMLGTILMATSRHERSIEKDKSKSV